MKKPRKRRKPRRCYDCGRFLPKPLPDEVVFSKSLNQIKPICVPCAWTDM